MSQENLEIVTRAVQAALARPEPDFAAVNELYAPDHVFVPAGADMLEREARGARGFRAWREETQEFLGAEHDLKGAVDVAPDKVLVVTTTRFEGTASGFASEQRIWNVVTVAGGKITRTEAYTEPAQALEAAGLRE
jgi:ketosteroid isomerase-like protein